MKFDAIIIGNGPAGISAAIYIKRSGLNPVIISKKESNLLKAEKVENYYGFPDPISGQDLYNQGIDQAKNLNIQILEEEVLSIQLIDDFKVETKDNEYHSNGVIIATGSSRNIPNIKNISEFEGRGVSYCAICDGFFFRKKQVAILGNKDYAYHEAKVLQPIAEKVTILTNGKNIEFNNEDKFEIITNKIKQINGEMRISSIQFEDDTQLNVDGLFVALGTASSTDFARKIGAIIENNKIVVNNKMETNIPGLYACGDAVDGLPQIAKAVYEGALAGIELSKYLKRK